MHIPHAIHSSTKVGDLKGGRLRWRLYIFHFIVNDFIHLELTHSVSAFLICKEQGCGGKKGGRGWLIVKWWLTRSYVCSTYVVSVRPSYVLLLLLLLLLHHRHLFYARNMAIEWSVHTVSSVNCSTCMLHLELWIVHYKHRGKPRI